MIINVYDNMYFFEEATNEIIEIIFLRKVGILWNDKENISWLCQGYEKVSVKSFSLR